MIKGFADTLTENAFRGIFPRKRFPPDLAKRARRKLEMIDKARSFGDLAHPPGNGLHALTGDRAGQYALKINDQWRICFIWDGRDASEVEIVDYH